MCVGEIGQVIDVLPSQALASCGGRARPVSLLTLPDTVRPGDWILLHSGFALARLTPDEARDAIALRNPPTMPEAG